MLGRAIITFFFLAYSLSRHILNVYHTPTWCSLNANLQCRSEMCCTRLAENTERKKSQKIRHLGIIAQLCQAIATKAC